LSATRSWTRTSISWTPRRPHIRCASIALSKSLNFPTNRLAESRASGWRRRGALSSKRPDHAVNSDKADAGKNSTDWSVALIAQNRLTTQSTRRDGHHELARLLLLPRGTDQLNLPGRSPKHLTN